jgi:hypothetical protein
MPEIISCPSCRRKLQAPESLQGYDVQCPTCGATFTANFGPSRSEHPGPDDERRDNWSGTRGDDYDLHDEPRGDWGGTRRDWKPHRGSAILTVGVLALVGLILCLPALILGPAAWAMGNNDMALIRAGRMDPAGEHGTSAGQICGMIATLLGYVGLVVVCLHVVNEKNFF